MKTIKRFQFSGSGFAYAATAYAPKVNHATVDMFS